MNLIHLLLRTSWLTIALAVSTGFLSGISRTGLIALLNSALTGGKPIVGLLVWSFVGLCLLLLVTNIASQVLLARLCEGTIFNLRMFLSDRILVSPLRQLEEIGVPRLLATLTDDVQSVSNAVSVFPALFTNLAVVISCLIYLSWLSLPVFFLVLAVIVATTFSFQWLMTKARNFFALAREQQDRLFKHFQALTEGSKELKLHLQRQKTFLDEEIRVTASTCQHYGVIGTSILSIATTWSLLALFIIIGLLVFALPRLMDITTSVLSSCAFVILYVAIPLNSVVNLLPVLSRANVALNKIESLDLLLADYITEANNVSQPEVKLDWKRLDLVGVTHTYHREREESNFILGPIDLKLNAGELIFLVGGNGSGKASLAKLIVGLYPPETGKIYVDGEPINHHNQVWYRQHFSVVFCDFYLFECFLGLSRDDLDSQAQDYLIQLQLEHKVQVQNGRLSTTALSQGQRKRLALLTAYLEDRPIYVFDEWASDQDPVFKEIFYTRLLLDLKKRGKTVLAITHDDHYFHLADRILKLDYGQLQ